jgi:hypothetical protein
MNKRRNMKKSSIILGLAVALSAWSVVAQPSGDPPDQGTNAPPGEGRPGRHHRPPPDSLIVRTLDTNGDGIIDAAEIANAPAALKTLDANGDGQLTKDEYLPHRPGGGTNGPPPGFDKKHHPPTPIIDALDVNKDGVIDAAEIANAPDELLTLDKNGDGQLTPDEYRPPRPPGDGPPPGGPDGPGDGNGPGGDAPKGSPPQQ